MNAKKLENYYKDNANCEGAGYLRFILMFFVCFWSFTIPEPTGFLSAISGFAAPCFFILSGFFVFTNNKARQENKIVRKLGRTLKCLAFMFVVYLVINILVLVFTHTGVAISKRLFFNFFVLNLWPLPIGKNFWFLQAMAYAYALILLAYKLKLMRFYKIALVVTMLIMLLTGEFAGLIHFNILGYTYIPGNWLTRALPYIFLGMLIREKASVLLRIRTWVYIVMFVLGAALVVGEIILLGRLGLLVYEGHMIGYGIMAVAAVGLAIRKPDAAITPISFHDTSLSGLIYVFMDPVYYLIAFGIGLIGNYKPLLFMVYAGGLAALIISIVLAFVLQISPLPSLFFGNYHIKSQIKKELDDAMEVKNTFEKL